MLGLVLYVQLHISIREGFAQDIWLKNRSLKCLSRGNWSVDLQAGAAFGYRPMLFVLLMAGLGAIVLQVSFGVIIMCLYVLILNRHWHVDWDV